MMSPRNLLKKIEYYHFAQFTFSQQLSIPSVAELGDPHSFHFCGLQFSIGTTKGGKWIVGIGVRNECTVHKYFV